MSEQTSEGLDREMLLAFLETHDAACPLCQYNLRKLTEPRCPECGREVRLTVGMVEPFLMPWITTTLCLTLAASIGVRSILLVLLLGPSYLPRFDDVVVCAVIGYAWLAIPLTMLVLIFRGWFLRQNRAMQLIMTLITLATDGALLTAAVMALK